MIRIDCAQGSPEWLAARLGIATASCFSSVLATIKSGEAAERRNYRAKLIVERLTKRPVAGFTTAAMQQGTEREPFGRAAYESRTGNFVDEIGFCRHDTLEAGASPDGLIDTDGGLEIKCPELATHLSYIRLKTEPAAYTAQIQGCMWITGRAWWDFASFNPDFPEHLQLVVRRVPRDEKAIASLEFAVGLFMEEVRAEEAEVRKLAA
jgi:YqaJ-like viral recombinase domain